MCAHTHTHAHTLSHMLLWHFFLQCNWILPLAILGNISQEKLKELQECRRILKEKKEVVAGCGCPGGDTVTWLEQRQPDPGDVRLCPWQCFSVLACRGSSTAHQQHRGAGSKPESFWLLWQGEGRVVYIRNLSSSMSSSELKKRFEVFGEIVECQVLSRTNRWVGSELWPRAPAATGSPSPQGPSAVPGGATSTPWPSQAHTLGAFVEEIQCVQRSKGICGLEEGKNDGPGLQCCITRAVGLITS